MLPRKIFENLIVIYVMLMELQLQCFLNNFLTNISVKFIASNSESNTTILWGPYKCPPQPEEPNFGDASIRHCPPRYKKLAENIG